MSQPYHEINLFIVIINPPIKVNMLINSTTAELLPVKTIDGTVYVDPYQIVWLDADSKHTLIYLKGETEFIRSIWSISVLKKMLPQDMFFKCHRSHIINLRYLKKLEKNCRSVKLADNYIVPISEDNISEFLQRTNPYFHQKV